MAIDDRRAYQRRHTETLYMWRSCKAEGGRLICKRPFVSGLGWAGKSPHAIHDTWLCGLSRGTWHVRVARNKRWLR